MICGPAIITTASGAVLRKVTPLAALRAPFSVFSLAQHPD
jgi:hypothetical protein